MQVVNNIDFKKNYSERMSPLFELGNDSLMYNFKKETYDKLDFENDDIDELIRLAVDDSCMDTDEDSCEKYEERLYYASIHAVYVLGIL